MGPSKAGPHLIATPNPVPRGTDPGSVKLAVELGSEDLGEVWVSVNGKPETRIMRVERARNLGWINSGAVYEFRLYKGTNHSELLDSIRVTKER